MSKGTVAQTVSVQRLMTSTAALGLAVALAHPALAEQAAPAESEVAMAEQPTAGEIIVTARKRAERLQEVPIAITAITTETLQRNSVTTSMELQRLSPNFTIGQLPNASYAAQPSIRGQVQEEVLISVDPSVAVYFDGVYVARQSGGVFDTVDISQIEVIKGPQGTLFGRNTTGGAVSVTTNKADLTAGLGGWARAGIESFGGRRLSGVLNVPVTDTFGLRFAGQSFNSDGYIMDVITDRRHYGHDDWQGRASFLWRPSSSIEVSGMYDRFEGHLKGGAAVRLRRIDPGAGAAEATIENLFKVAPFGGSGQVPPADLTQFTRLAADETASGEYGFAQLTNQMAVLNVEATLADTLTGKVIYGWRKSQDSRSDDLDGTPALLVNAQAQFGAIQHTVEAQLLGENADRSIKWILGGFFFDERGYSDSQNFFIPCLQQYFTTGTVTGTCNPVQGIFDDDARNRSYAVFGQADIGLAPGLTFTGGIRHTWDRKTVILRNRNVSFANPLNPTLVNCNVPRPIDVDGAGPICEGRQSRNFGYFSWLASLNYKVSPDLMVWGKVAQASRAGGFNIRAGVSGVDAAPFDPETIREYEVGLKSTVFGGVGTIDAALFYAQGRDLQRTVLLNTANGVSTVIQNAAEATFKGFEIESSWKLSDSLTFDLSGGYLDASFDRYTNSDGTDLRPNTQFKFTADWTLNAGLSYVIPIGSSDLRLSASAYHAENYKPVTEVLPQRGGRSVDYTLVNMRAQLDRGPVSIAVFVKNLTNNTYPVADFNFIGQTLNYTAENRNMGRLFGGEVTYRF